MKSLQSQIITRVLGVLLIALLISVYISHVKALHEIEEIFDAELAQTARMISKFTLSHIDSTGKPDASTKLNITNSEMHKYEKNVSYQVWYKNALLLKSSNALNIEFGNTPGYADINIDNQSWRVFSLHPSNSPYRIYTAQNWNARDELAWEFALQSLSIFFWAFPVFGFLIMITVKKGLLSLTHISSQVRELESNEIHSIKNDNVPSEVAPLIDALNDLLKRLDSTITRERQFSSDASHELRTPLAAIKLHAQLAQRSNCLDDKQSSLDKVLVAVDQSTHLTDQLLSLSRLDSSEINLITSTVNVEILLLEIKESLSILAESQSIIIEIETKTKVIMIDSNPELLRIIIRNLLDNAIRYAFPNSLIHCLIIASDQQLVISIIDNGPGIPEDKLPHINKRFYRLASQETKGCGLGLAITQQAVSHLLGASLSFENRNDGKTGLVAKVSLSTS